MGGSSENMVENQPPCPPSPRNKILHYLSYITVEPTMVCYMMAFMITTVVEQSLFVYKACKVNHGYNETVCRHINEKQYEDINKKVQITVSNFHLWNDVAGHTGQIILAFFMGAWSDKRGRKLPLLMGLIGKFYYSFMVVINSTQSSWPVEYIVLTATLPMSFTGADVIIFAAAFSYLVDVSSSENRTLRVTLLEVFYLSTMPIGIALGSLLYNKVVNQSYTAMFIINVSLLAAAILYSVARLEWQTNARQRPLSEARNVLADFFDYRHVVDTAKTMYKKRPSGNRVCLSLLVLMMALYTFQRDERNMMFLYCQLIFNWDLSQYSNFRTFQSALQDVGLLVAIPVMSKLLGWKDTFIIMFGAAAHSIARIFYANATVGWVFYTGGVFAAFGPIVAPVIRSMVSKIVTLSEKGKALAVLSVADNAIPLISGVLYSKLYNATIHNAPESMYYLTMGTQITVFILILYIHFYNRNIGEESENEDEQVNEDPSEQTQNQSVENNS